MARLTHRGPVEIGRTGVFVPPLGFGTSALGSMPDTYGYPVDEAQARETVHAILDGPCPFIDTSRNYGLGQSEIRIGAALAERGGLPQGAVISTKLDRDMETGRFDADRARRSLEESLEALGLSRVDILHLHDPEHAIDLNEITRPGGALDMLFHLREEGLTIAVGLAAGRIDLMMPILRDWDFDAVITHNRFSLVNRNAEPLMDLARSRFITVLLAAPYAGGVLAKGSAEYPRYVYQDAADDMLEPVRAVERLCLRHKVPLGAAALQFAMRDGRVGSTICGVTRPERVQQSLEWAAVSIPDEFWDELAMLAFSIDDPEATRVYRPG